jgi:hypothetical protein
MSTVTGFGGSGGPFGDEPLTKPEVAFGFIRDVSGAFWFLSTQLLFVLTNVKKACTTSM